MTATLEPDRVEDPSVGRGVDPPPPSEQPPWWRRYWPPQGRPAAAAPLSRPRMVLVFSAVTLSALLVWSVLYVLVISSIQHARAQHELYAKFRSQLAQATAPIGGVIAVGKPVALLTVPAAGLQGEVVLEGTTSGVMRDGPGHVRSSPLPGQPGISVIYGRALSFGAPFGRIADLTPGAEITATTDQGVFHYVVSGVRRAGDKWTLPDLTKGRLTLVTSEGGWIPDQVVYVDAVLRGPPSADPGGRLSGIGTDERLMAGQADSLTLVEIVLWLQLLVVIAAGVTWLATRWGRWQVWLVAVPVALAVLWGASNTAVQVLPNLM